MKELLMKNANELYWRPSRYEEYRHKIEKVRYKICCLSEKEFNGLVFMEANDTVWDKNQELVNKLTPKDESRTLQDVVERIVAEYPHDSPIKIFKHLSEDEPWFDGCFIVSARFDPRLLGELKIRPLAFEEKEHSSEGSFYLEDGNHRALVYSVFLRLGKIKEYEPVRVIFREDWEHIYPWGKVPSKN